MKRNLQQSLQFFICVYLVLMVIPEVQSQTCPLTVAGIPDFYTFELDVSGEYSAVSCLVDYGAIINIDGVVYNQTSCFNPGDGWVAVYSKTVGIGAGASLPFTANFVFGSCEYDIGGVLPVELARFSGQSNGSTVELVWTTLSEWNNEGFEVQRLVDLQGGASEKRQWIMIGFVPGAGHASIATDYRFTDQEPITGRAYYRLQQLDFDGALAYSSIITVDHRPSNRAASIGLYPNPFTSSIHLRLDNAEVPTDIPYVVYDTGGRMVASGNLPESREIDLHQLPPATYLLSVRLGQLNRLFRLIRK